MSQELLDAVEKAHAEIAELEKEKSNRLASAEAHEKAARDDRLAYGECKVRVAALQKSIESRQVKAKVASAIQEAEALQVQAKRDSAASAKEREEVASMKVEVANKLREVDEALAKMKSTEQA